MGLPDEYALPKLGDLSGASIDASKDEILRRSKTAVVIVVLKDGDDDENDLIWATTGRRSLMLGIMEMLKSRILDELRGEPN
jgi:hypothetical protein